MTDKQGVCHSHRPCWCPLYSDYLVLCVYTAGVWAPCPPLVWVRGGQSLLFLHSPTLPGEWMSHFIDHLLKASRGTRGKNPIPQYWCPSIAHCQGQEDSSGEGCLRLRACSFQSPASLEFSLSTLNVPFPYTSYLLSGKFVIFKVFASQLKQNIQSILP